jgi:hypothetical protein
MTHDLDPEEHIGRDNTGARAEPPKGKAAAPAPVLTTGETNSPVELAVSRPQPPSKAVYTPPAAGESHPKHAKLGPALRLDRAEASLTDATLELHAATTALHSAELAEERVHQVLITLLPRKSADDVNRERLARVQADKLSNVQQGFAPEPKKKIIHGNSPLDAAAANRQRVAPGVSGYSLRSPVVRR